jgi:hypothetical protein
VSYLAQFLVTNYQYRRWRIVFLNSVCTCRIRTEYFIAGLGEVLKEAICITVKKIRCMLLHLYLKILNTVSYTLFWKTSPLWSCSGTYDINIKSTTMFRKTKIYIDKLSCVCCVS